MNIQRTYLDKLNAIKTGFPIIWVVGARQVGKTTFLKEQFPDYQYYNLETPITLMKIKQDPLNFLQNNSHIIIDEIQRCPELFSYLQEIVDTRKEMADFIISWSENLILSEKISQSLAWRVWYIEMNPFLFSELQDVNLLPNTLYDQIFKGFFPTLYDREIAPDDYYDGYIATYIERDVRQIKDIKNLDLFRNFLALLAWRIGQMVNYVSLCNDLGVEVKTLKSWISILEASYLVFQLHPYYENFGKRFIKSPKIYFTDTGLVCRLLWIKSAEELKTHYLLWNLFENMVVSELKKQMNILWYRNNLYFYRDSNQNEVDVIVDYALKQIPIEIKSSSTFSQEFSKGIKYWNSLPHKKQQENGLIIYTGDDFEMTDYHLVNRINYQRYL